MHFRSLLLQLFIVCFNLYYDYDFVLHDLFIHLTKTIYFIARILQFKQPLLHLCQQMHDYGYNLENLALQNIFLLRV